MNVVVYGAGAVGSVLGGLLAMGGHSVLLVCRGAHARAVRDADGLRLRSATGDYVAPVRAAETFDPDRLGEDACILLTVKSYDTEAAVEALSGVPASVPVVCFQNGVANEPIVAERFERVYGGVCRMTCSMIQPGTASVRRFGRAIVGRHPKGSDAFARGLARALGEAGAEGVVSRNITADKWLKLAVNTQSAFHAVIDPRDHDRNEFHELKASILGETRAVFKAARIRAKSCDGRDPSIDQMIADLRRPRVSRPTVGMRVHNSTWQNLYLRRPRLENGYFHGPVIDLAREHGVPVPCNETALELVESCHRRGVGPGAYRLDEVLALVRGRGGAA